MRFDEFGYGAVSAFYEELAALYSFGRIAASKRRQLDFLEPGDRVLYAGVGRGEDAVEAARLGVRVTGVDLSSRMLAHLEERLAREGLEAELIRGDVAKGLPPGDFDAVVANYFLNLFEAERAAGMLELLAERVRPGGLLLCADFARPEGRGIGRWLTEAYYRPVNWLAWAIGLCALHPILDYPALLEPLGFRIRLEQRWPIGPGRSPAYLTIVAERS